jgi:hypothetical protein
VDYSNLTPEQLIELLKQKDSELETSDQVIGELKEDLAAKEDELLVLSPIVKVGKDQYEIVIPVFNLYDPKEQTTAHYTAKDVQKDDKLAAQLVKQGSGVLRKIEKK